MLSFIVLGQIPGTNLHFGFLALVVLFAVAFASVYGYALYKTPLSSSEETDNHDQIAL